VRQSAAILRLEQPRIYDWPASKHPAESCFTLHIVFADRDLPRSYLGGMSPERLHTRVDCRAGP
jgi:hypothetical protein